LGFKNAEGYSTNLIEGLWSQIKNDITMRKGIKQENIPDYLKEFK
jgi:hypothetical protein